MSQKEILLVIIKIPEILPKINVDMMTFINLTFFNF